MVSSPRGGPHDICRDRSGTGLRGKAVVRSWRLAGRRSCCYAAASADVLSHADEEAPVRRLVRYRDMRLLLAGETLSLFGDRAMFLALGIWVKTLTGSS